MIWTVLFAVSIAQGVFLLFLIWKKGFKNFLALRFLSAMLAIIILTNLGYLTIRTDLLDIMPQLFAVPFGMMFLFGPLFYFYNQALIESSFTWKRRYWLHFIPYCLSLVATLPIFAADMQVWKWFINNFLSGTLPIRFTEKIMFGLQVIHLLFYLLAVFGSVKQAKQNSTQYLVSVSDRTKWIMQLLFCFGLVFETAELLHTLKVDNLLYD